ncbi:MAG: hypothetical protein V1845_02005 [bacterium]
MNKPIKFTLLGSIPKGDEVRKNWIDWKSEYVEKISASIPEAKFLHGDLISDNVGPDLVVGHDLWLIKNSDIVIVHAVSKIGAGTAQEMVLTKYFLKPLISIVPKGTHHRRTNVVFHGVNIEDWIHPFIYVASDYVAENIDSGIKWIKEFLKNRDAQSAIKDISVFENKIVFFEKELPAIVNSYREKGW